MSNIQYWGGNSAFTKTIRPLEAHSFKELVEAYIFIPVTRPNMTRAEYHALSDDEQKRVKDCAFICACDFKPDAQRCDAEAINVNLVIIDLDEGGDEFFESPESIAEALFPYNFVTYSTATHTPEKPRLKVVVDVKSCDKKWHKPLARHVIRLLGLDPKFKGSIESKVLSQPQYRPIQFKGEDFDCVLASRTDGIQLSHADLPAEEPTDDERIFAWDGELGSDLAYLPLEGLKVEDIREPLFTISPDINYREWTRIAASLRHQFREEPMAREAFELFEEWSATGDKYREGDPYNKWRSFRPDAIGKAPSTIRSLFYMALEAGWDGRKVTLSFKKQFLTWLNNCTDEDELFDEGCKKIAMMPFPDAIVEDLLVQSLQARVSKISGIKPTKKSVEDKLARVKKIKRAEKASKEVPAWLRPFCFISTTNKFRNAVNGTEMSVEGFNNNFSMNLISKDKADENAGSARPSILPQHYALNQIEIKRVEGVMYDPRNGGVEPYFTYKGKTFLNTYLPSSLPEEDPTRSALAGEMFMEHLSVLIEEEEYRMHFLHFLCHVVQKPGVKILWAPIIQSAEGAGKGFLTAIMQAVLGEGNVKSVNSEVIQEKYTGWMIGAVLSVLNEIHIPGAKRQIVANSLKMMIADKEIPVMEKYLVTVTEVPNLTNSIAFSNHHDSMYLSEGDRRWMCIESPLQSKADIQALNATGHFTKMEPLKGELGGALRHWMLNYKIPADFPVHGPAPITTYRQSSVEASKNPMLRAIEELIENGSDPLVARDIVHGKRVEEVLNHLIRSNGSPFRYLKQLGFIQQGTATINGESTPVWVRRRRFDGDLGTAEEQLNDRCKMERMIA